MSTKEKAHPTAATVERAGTETAAFGRAAISCSHCTTGGADRQPGFIENLLFYGPENGQTVTDEGAAGID